MLLIVECINYLFMILSNCCVDNDKRGLIRRKLLYSMLCELRFNSFFRQLKKESEWQVLFVANLRFLRLEEHLSVLQRTWYQLVNLTLAKDVTECPLRLLSAYVETEDLAPLLQREQHFRNLRKNYPSIVEILGGDWHFKVDRLNTRSYVLEFDQQSPMFIEGQSLLPSPALTMASATRSSAR